MILTELKKYLNKAEQGIYLNEIKIRRVKEMWIGNYYYTLIDYKEPAWYIIRFVEYTKWG